MIKFQLAAEPSLSLNTSNISSMKGKGPASICMYTGCRKEKKQVPKYLKYYCITAEEAWRKFPKWAEHRVSQ